MPGALVSVAGAALLLGLAAAAAVPLLPPLVEPNNLGAGWRVALLPEQALPATRFTPELVDGRLALRVEAHRSYGNLVHEMAPLPAPGALRWSWRVLQHGAPGDLRAKAGDDAAMKVCLSFDLPLARVPFVERQLLRVARAKSGQALPTATLCWVWAGTEPRETALDNAWSRRVRYIVLRNAQDPAGTWFDESRDIAADFRRAFGDESTELPPITAVIVSGDADNTGGHSVAFIDDLRFDAALR